MFEYDAKWFNDDTLPAQSTPVYVTRLGRAVLCKTCLNGLPLYADGTPLNYCETCCQGVCSICLTHLWPVGRRVSRVVNAVFHAQSLGFMCLECLEE